jgi:hypothetical protein
MSGTEPASETAAGFPSGLLENHMKYHSKKNKRDLTFGLKSIGEGHWTWGKHVEIVGPEKTIEQIVNQNVSFSVLAGLLVSVMIGPLLSADVNPDSNSARAFLGLMIASNFCCLALIFISVWVIANINVLRCFLPGSRI